MSFDGEGLDGNKFLVGGRCLPGQANGLHGQGQGYQGGKEMPGKVENFHEQGEAEEGRQHETGVDEKGVFQPQPGYQVFLGCGGIGLEVRKFIDPENGGNEEGQRQTDVKSLGPARPVMA